MSIQGFFLLVSALLIAVYYFSGRKVNQVAEKDEKVFLYSVVGAVVLAFSIWIMKGFLGYPVQTSLPDRWELIEYYVDVKQDNIYVWILENDEDVPRAVTIDNDKSSRKALSRGMSEKQKGHKVIFGKGGKNKRRNRFANRNTLADHEMFVITIQNLFRKKQ